MLFRLVTLVTKLKKINYNTKINEIENKILDHGHDKSNTAQEFNKSTA